MNPNHPKNLEAALYKFGFLTYAQIADFFAGELKGRSIRRCIAQLKKDRLIAVSRPDESDGRFHLS